VSSRSSFRQPRDPVTRMGVTNRELDRVREDRLVRVLERAVRKIAPALRWLAFGGSECSGERNAFALRALLPGIQTFVLAVRRFIDRGRCTSNGSARRRAPHVCELACGSPPNPVTIEAYSLPGESRSFRMAPAGRYSRPRTAVAYADTVDRSSTPSVGSGHGALAVRERVGSGSAYRWPERALPVQARPSVERVGFAATRPSRFKRPKA